MNAHELSARLRFLDDAAYLLSKSAPHASRHIMSKRNALLFDQSMEDRISRSDQIICRACGTILGPGSEITTRVQSQPTRRRKNNCVTKRLPRNKEIVYHCECCDRNTRTKIPQTNAPDRSKLIQVSSTLAMPSIPMPLPIQFESKSGPIVSTASKKKARKRGGLDAILANKRAADARQSGFGLDLLDFMKKT